jgi:hypothetical protein
MSTIRYYATIRNELLHGSLKELSEYYCEIRDESGEGCSTFRPVNVCIAGTAEAIGHISYNGRIWDRPVNGGLSIPLCLDDSKLLYDNRAAPIEDDDGLDSEGYPLGSPREWSDEELKELRRRERACDDYGSL